MSAPASVSSTDAREARTAAQESSARAPASPRSEIVNVVDRENRVVAHLPRARVRKENLLHQSTSIFLENSRGELYVQRRTKTKDYCPGFLDPCAGGVLQAGEEYAESARRELAEEMGVSGVPLEHCFTFLYEDERTRCFSDVWWAVYDGKLKLQAEEVEEVLLLAPQRVLEDAASGASGERYTPDGLEALRRLLAWKRERAARKS